MEELFYLQDSRGYVGNDILWWAKNGMGYTTDLSKAETYTKVEAEWHNRQRTTDIPWPKAYIDAKTRPAVDMQYVSIDEALEGTGIVLVKPERHRKEQKRCYECGRFLSDCDYYSPNGCPHCGCDNRP